MKALVLKQINEPLVFEEREPLAAGHGEAVVRLKAAALNRRDFWITQGMYPGIRTPVVLGSDGAGVVSSVGDGVSGEWIGRDVIINPGFDWGNSQTFQSREFSILGMPRDGTFATEVAVRVGQLHAKPAHLHWKEAAALPLGGVTAYRAVFSQGALREGERVLVTGIGGGVATLALQFAVAAGGKVWVTSSSPEKIGRAVRMGAQGGTEYTSETWSKQLGEDAGDLDLIIDGAGGRNYGVLIQAAAPGGRIVNYGATAGAPGTLDLFKVFWKQLHLIGSTMGSPEDFAAMLRFVERHGIRPVIDASFPLADGRRALDRMKRSPQFGKVVLEME